MSSLKPPSPFPFPFPVVPSSLPPSRRPSSATVIRLSRWNNANAEPHLRRRREQQQIEDDIRRHRRHRSAAQIASPSSFPSPTSPPPSKSFGTPSSPSPPSIPGKSSKYSKPPLNPKPPPHPAFRRPPQAAPVPIPASGAVSLTDRGIAYRVDGAPFEFQYSYTETPKVKPLALREPPFLPFGPSTMPRPWTGRAPLPPSKKKLPEFDSFKLPPPGKKGVKPVQSPGPFVAGSGPRYTTASREEVLGEPLTEVEVKELVKGSLRVRRLLNIGRDGLTHNMLENIHAHWKRRRICKIKCIGVCTVDMDNVRQQLEEKTGGKIIYNRGGVIFLFRGRNYNYRTRPRYPLMLWKPVAAVYPRLVPKVPEGLTPQEATEMRKNGHKLPPICKIGKNGLYSNLVQHVREAFEECELVRINCTGLNKSDYKKIGAKLQDLVPCILLSFAYEHILMWRGKDWKSSLPSLEDDSKKDGELIAGEPKIILLGTVDSLSSNQEVLNKLGLKTPMGSTVVIEDVHRGESEVPSSSETTADQVVLPTTYPSKVSEIVDGSSIVVGQVSLSGMHQEPPRSLVRRSSEDSPRAMPCESFARVEDLNSEERKDVLHPECELEQLPTSLGLTQFEKVDTRTRDTTDELETVPTDSSLDKGTVKSSACLDGVMLLLKQAVDGGSAIILDDESLDANIVYERSVALAKTAPRGPVFQQRIRKATVKRAERPKVEKYEEKLVDVEVAEVSAKSGNERKKSSRGREDIGVIPSDVVPHGSLGVDELAKLLA